MCERASSALLDLLAGRAEDMASSSSSVSPAAPDPAFAVPPTKVVQISKFLALRLTCGTPAKTKLCACP